MTTTIDALIHRLEKAFHAANPPGPFTELPKQVYSEDGEELLYETPAERVKPGTLYKVYLGWPDEDGVEP